jgi:hypothetical protein
MVHQLQSPLPNVFFSQRRRTRQRTVGQAQRGGSLPDWVWGAGLGVIALIFVGGFFLFSSVTGGGGGSCDTPLSILTPHTVDAAGFNKTDAQLGHIIDFLNQNDISTASDVLYSSGDVHAFVHSADSVIRTKDVTVGKSVCTVLIQFETDLENPAGRSASTLIREATELRKDMQDGAVALGFPRPGT